MQSPRRPLLILSTCLPLALLLCTAGAFAESHQDRADTLFREGKARAKAKDWGQAHRLLAEAWQLKQSYDIASNLGQVAYLLGRHAEAAQRVAFALRHYPPTGDAEQKAKAESLFDLAKREVAIVHLNVSHPEAQVEVDGMAHGPARSLPPEVFVEPGPHTIRARLQGETVQRQVQAQRGAVYSVDLVLSPGQDEPRDPDGSVFLDSSSPNPQPDSVAPPENTGITTKHVVLLVGGGLTVASAIGLSAYSLERARAASRANSYRVRASESGGVSACRTSTTLDCRRLAEANSDYRQAGTGQKVFLGMTLGFAAGTLASYLLWPAADPAQPSDVARLHAVISPELQVLQISGSF